MRQKKKKKIWDWFNLTYKVCPHVVSILIATYIQWGFCPLAVGILSGSPICVNSENFLYYSSLKENPFLKELFLLILMGFHEKIDILTKDSRFINILKSLFPPGFLLSEILLCKFYKPLKGLKYTILPHWLLKFKTLDKQQVEEDHFDLHAVLYFHISHVKDTLPLL